MMDENFGVAVGLALGPQSARPRVSEGRRARKTSRSPNSRRTAYRRARIAQGGAWPARTGGAMTKAEVFMGIDVSKARLDVALGFAGELFGVDNDARGFAELVSQLRKLGPELIVLEASGGLETVLVGELAAAQLPVAVVNLRQVRHFARANGQLPKTDTLDAKMLALFAERMRPPLRALPDEQTRQLQGFRYSSARTGRDADRRAQPA